ncbi:DUF4282 domain-containing protein [Actinomyces slackii]|uniref:DUF4282 domain-containing protein n=2 Tax=Actinomyces slackii TaxID=52774 RepID=A0A3S4SIU1_9ACTO|nr:DUF4282 domain-containing protein [Actinomyces slackii]VEG73621.1 Uncharacterised protein [Actinomyces slackii]
MTQPINPDQSHTPPPAPQADSYSAGSAPTGSYPPPAPYPPQPASAPDPMGGYPVQAAGYPGYAPVQQRGFFSALFDMSFSQYITITWVKVVYILCLIAIAIGWFFGAFMMGTVAGIGGGSYGSSEFDPGAFFFALIFGLIPAFLHVIGIRLLLEFIVAIIRTEQNTRALAQRPMA